MNEENIEKVFSVKEIAKIFNRSEIWVRSVLRSGKMHGEKLSNKHGWIITMKDLEDYTRNTYGLSVNDYMTISNYEGASEEEPDEDIPIPPSSVNNIAVCPYCGHKNLRNRVASIRYNSDGYLVRYRKCEKCHVLRRTFEIYPSDFEKLVKLKKRVETLALDLNKACEEAK